MTGDECAAELRATRREAKEVLLRHGVPLLVLSERRWLCDAAAFRAFIAGLEQQSRERAAQRELQVDYLKPTRGKAARRARR